MIDFRILGAIDLRNDDGAEVRSVLAQPRRVALLAYLALRSAQEVERRDSLLGVFWPESDATRARGALRNAVHFLRRSLGADAIESRTGDELRVDPDRVRCDAVEFLRLLEEGRREEALELYRGDLLEGFFISGAPGFERWLDAERRSLRRRAAEAADALVEVAEAEGRVGLAAQHARRAVTISPEDERAARRLISLLWRTGDRTGALQAYEELVSRLSTYEVGPSPETRELVEGLRDEATGDAVARGPAGAVGPVEGRDGAKDPAAGSDDGRREEGVSAGASAGVSDARRRRRYGAAAGVLALALLVSVASIFRAERFPADGNSPDLVAVFPFSFRGGEEFAFLEEGMVNLLSADLDGAGELRAVDPGALLTAVDRRGAPARDPAAASAIAGRLGAGRFVLGDVVETGDRLRVTATVYASGRRGAAQLHAVTVEGTAERLFDLVDDLARRLLEGWVDAAFPRSGTRGTESIPAWKAYVRGETEYRAGRYGAALEAFQRAVREDSGFALAHYRVSNAAIWVNRDVLANRAAGRALALAGTLGREDSLMVAAWSHLRSGRADVALGLYGRLVELRPQRAESWLQLGEIQFHWGPTFGTPSADARTAFEKVLEGDPDHVGALIHLARLAARAREMGRLDTLISRALSREPEGPWILEMEALRGALSDDDVRRERALRTAALAPDRVARSILVSVAAHAHEMEVTAGLARSLASRGRSDELRATAHLMAAEAELARGRWSAALRELETPDGLPVARILEFRAMFGALPFLPVSDSEISALRVALQDPARPAAPIPGPEAPLRRGRGAFPPLAWDGIFEPRRLYLLASLAARLGRAEEALESARELERLGQRSGLRLARLVRARVAFLGGDAAGALALLGSPGMPAIPTYETLLDYASGYERYLRGELNETLGRPEEALRWYATFPTPTAANLPYLAPATLRRARIHEDRGELEEAVALYRRFLALWADADPELRAPVEEARERLAQLR